VFSSVLLLTPICVVKQESATNNGKTPTELEGGNASVIEKSMEIYGDDF
jgi:hypothetical protein